MKLTYPQKLTLGAMGVSAVILAVVEVKALADSRPDDTISEFVWKANKQTTLLAFATGVLCGHFFWNNTNSPTATVSVTTEATT